MMKYNVGFLVLKCLDKIKTSVLFFVLESSSLNAHDYDFDCVYNDDDVERPMTVVMMVVIISGDDQEKGSKC